MEYANDSRWFPSNMRPKRPFKQKMKGAMKFLDQDGVVWELIPFDDRGKKSTILVSRCKVYMGGRPPDNGFNIALRACEEIVAKDPTKCIFYDIESGWPTVITKEERKRIIKLMESCIPKTPIDFNVKGLYFYGTGGKMEDNGSWEEIFKK